MLEHREGRIHAGVFQSMEVGTNSRFSSLEFLRKRPRLEEYPRSKEVVRRQADNPDRRGIQFGSDVNRPSRTLLHVGVRHEGIHRLNNRWNEFPKCQGNRLAGGPRPRDEYSHF